MKKNYLVMIIIVIVIGLGAFFAGYKYGQNKTAPAFGNFADLSPEERQQLRTSGFGVNQNNLRTSPTGVEVINGEILNKDENSLTIKLPEGGSKIIFTSEATYFVKTIESSLPEFTIGEQVSVIGQTNDDGSLTAQSVQIRPAGLGPEPEKENLNN